MLTLNAANKKYYLFGFGFILLILTSLTAVVVLTKKQAASVATPPTFVNKETKKKIIYNPSSDLITIRADCKERGGTFSNCGSSCEKDEICTRICAYTCEFE